MNQIMGWIMGSFWLFVALAVIVLGGMLYKMRYKVAGADEALVITGARNSKKARILPGGGAFIPPNRKSDFFPLSVMTVRSDDQETHTSQMIPIVVKWTAQLRADIETDGALEKAVRGFGSYESDDISNSLKQTLDGEVRAVVATMTPEQVITDKVAFAEQVMSGVAPRMEELGFKLVSLNISEVSDRNGHYDNLAAKEREDKRQEAATLTADAQKVIDVKNAETKRASTEAELDRDLAIEEKTREVTLRKSAIQIETDTAKADAEVAGELRSTERAKEVAANRGAVAVVEAEQDEKAAAAQRAAALTRAETDRQRKVITAQAQKDQDEIAVAAEAAVAAQRAKGQADAAATKADGEARAARVAAQGKADSIKLTADATADEVRKTGLAEAEVERAKGEADAAAVLARGKAEAEAQRLMADALAANDGANLQVTLAEIQRDTTVKIYTTVGEAMARVGEHATFIDMGGSSSGNGSDLLTNVLGNIPTMLKKLDVQSEALQGASFGANLAGLVDSIKGNTHTVGAVGESADEPNGGEQFLDGVSLDTIVEGLGTAPGEVVTTVKALGRVALDRQGIHLGEGSSEPGDSE